MKFSKMIDLEKAYERRFSGDESFRKQMYQVLCRDFFQRYVPADSTVLDVAAGYCEFINNISAKKNIALDLNPAVAARADKDVAFVNAPSTEMKGIKDGSVDVAFVSNFFEHISKEDIMKTLSEIRRVLRKDGRLLVLQPNIRYCAKDYWMFFDHITPIDDRSLCEALELSGFSIKECRPRFLPFTTKGRLPKSIFLLRVYLALPALHLLFGSQAFVVAEKR